MKLTITDNELDKLNQLFKSEEYVLAIELIKGLNCKLEDILYMLYDKYSDGNWFILNQDSFEGVEAICIRFMQGLTYPYCLWTGTLNTITLNNDYSTLDECIVNLANILKQHYDK